MTDNAGLNGREAYNEKAVSYFTGARQDYLALLPPDPTARILELGCGAGETGRLALATGKAGHYVGIEAFEPMAAIARTVLTDVVVGDVERMELPGELSGFDALILSEVLEHLSTPDQVLKRLVRALKPGALVFASSPNISYWKNVANLIRGRFDYTESGMMDYTHLKWFTPNSFRRMFEEAGVVVNLLQPLETQRRSIKILMTLAPWFRAMGFRQINLHGVYRPDPRPAVSEGV